MRILVTEDDQMTRKVIEKSLNKAGYEVYLASDSTEAIERIEKDVFDVILIDIHMPGMSGIELIRRVRNVLMVNTPIAIVTRDKTEVKVREAFETGADDFIVKPFEPADLVKRIEKLAAKNA